MNSDQGALLLRLLSQLPWLGLPTLLLLATVRGQVRPQPQQPAPEAHHHEMPAATAPPADDRRMDRRMSPQEQAEAEATHAMQPGHQMDTAHMRMTPRRTASAQDLRRAEEIVVILRDVMEPYKDYRRALSDGYTIFMPDMPQREYHFNNYWNGFVEGFTFDPARPTSLLYRKTRDGYELTGAMYTAPRSASLDQLDERVPLGIARWHAHINLCMPQRGTVADWSRFGLSGSIATQDACRQAGGQFYPQVFGWMVHVYPYAAPEKIWMQ
jgi:hypothetical protein